MIGVETVAPEPNHGFSVVAGNRHEPGGDQVLGWMAAATYSHKYDFYEGGTNNNGDVSDPQQGIVLDKERTDSRGLDEVLIGILGNLAWRPNDRHEVSLKLVGNQSAEDVARLQVDMAAAPSLEQNQTLHYTERTLASVQFHGDHSFEGVLGTADRGFSDVELSWGASGNATRQEEPDVRFFRNFFDTNTLGAEMPRDSTAPQNIRRIWRDVHERDDQAAVDVTLPFTQWAGEAGRVKAGLFLERARRDYEQRSFTYAFATQQAPGGDPTGAVAFNRTLGSFQATNPDQLWTDLFLHGSRLGLARNGQPVPNQLLWYAGPVGNDVDYDGAQSIDAFYAMAELPLLPRLKVVGGARYETTVLWVDPFKVGPGVLETIEVGDGGDRALVPDDDPRAEIDEADLLPSLGAIYAIRPNMSLRASWARTLARPTFRELAPVATEEFIFGDEYFGNPDLKPSSITNYDLRWEWFRRPGEVLALSVFSKTIEDPIELISFAASNRSFIQPVNYESGEVKGAELEFRTGLDVLSPLLRGARDRGGHRRRAGS